MPGGDKTGPSGEGPMTGRRQGYCVGNDVPGTANAGLGRGFRGGRLGRGGYGARHRFLATGQRRWQQSTQETSVDDVPVDDASVESAVGDTPASISPRKQQVDALRRQSEQLANMLQDLTSQIDALDAQSQEP